MPLIAELPPRILPAVHITCRPFSDGSGSVMYIQSLADFPSMRYEPVGIVTRKRSLDPPASSSTTRSEGSSDNRVAITQPALPPPATKISA